jgi:hypothetical protein
MKYLFTVTEREMQEAAMHQLGRRLTSDELDEAENGLQAGLGIAAEISIKSILEDIQAETA